jgi:type VI secretion system protein VasG
LAYQNVFRLFLNIPFYVAVFKGHIMRLEKLEHLIEKLNATCAKTLGEARELCIVRSNLAVDIEHWIQVILQSPGSDFIKICKEYSINIDRLVGQITNRLDRLKRGIEDEPPFSERILELIGNAWLIASIDYHANIISTGHLLCALFSDDRFSTLTELTELRNMPLEKLRPFFPDIVKGSFESDLENAVARTATATKSSGSAGGVSANAGGGGALSQFTVDLTEQARQGRIDPVLGRDNEIRQIMDILMRRRQNNPILTGEAGVGKTAVVEGFAIRIAKQDVPEKLKNCRLLSLDLGALQAGAGMKGEFEKRLKGVIDEVKASEVPIILFIDEAHNLVGAGGSAGQGDAANLLKPALARGELRTVAATTWAEYKKYFESDAALSRRFQPVKVEEPPHDVAIEMMQGLIPTLEEHHAVRITPDAIKASVELSSRYIAGRQLPDKSVSVLDTTCARIALCQSEVPSFLEDARRKIQSLQLTQEIVLREAKTRPVDPEELKKIEKDLAEAKKIEQELCERWEKEKVAAKKVWELTSVLLEPKDKEKLDQAQVLSEEKRLEVFNSLQAAEKELQEIQGDRPLIHTAVTSASVAETIESWTGIPLGRMVADEIDTVLNLKSKMAESIVGQDHALETIAERILTARAGLRDPRTPIGVFMLAGTSGVGKTETAITLAELLYGGQQNLTVINMTEFKEEHKVSQLMGPPPGYKGYEAGGVLTEAVRRKPYSVVLLDEIEKAHEGVQEIFYQVFDKGLLRDGQGRDIDFKNTVIILTTNASSDYISKLCADPDTAPSPDGFIKAVKPKLLEVFKPAFLNRTTIVPYYPLRDEVLKSIVRLKLKKVSQRVTAEYKGECEFTEGVISQITSRCTEADAGARNIDHIVNKNLLPAMSRTLLARVASGVPLKKLIVDVDANGEFAYQMM